MKRFFASKKKENSSFFPKTKFESIRETNQELGPMSLWLCSALQAHICLSDVSDNSIVINLLKGRQSNLEQESDYDRDFTLKNEGDHITLEGNIKTGLICLRHAGLLSPDALPELVDKLEVLIKNEKLESSLLEQYEENYNLAEKRYPLEVSAPYPLNLKSGC